MGTDCSLGVCDRFQLWQTSSQNSHSKGPEENHPSEYSQDSQTSKQMLSTLMPRRPPPMSPLEDFPSVMSMVKGLALILTLAPLSMVLLKSPSPGLAAVSLLEGDNCLSCAAQTAIIARNATIMQGFMVTII